MWLTENKHIHGSRGSCGQHKAAAQSVVVCVPWVVFWAVVLLVKWQGAPLRIIVARWACNKCHHGRVEKLLVPTPRPGGSVGTVVVHDGGRRWGYQFPTKCSHVSAFAFHACAVFPRANKSAPSSCKSSNAQWASAQGLVPFLPKGIHRNEDTACASARSCSRQWHD